jgi:hypothetical protein
VAITVVPQISKSGQTLYLLTQTTGGSPQPAGISSIVANPSAITVNGNSVQFMGPYWLHSLLFPFVAYQLNCGPVLSVVVQAGGSSYTAPNVSISGGGSGSGFTVGTPVLSGGAITSIPVTAAGSGYTSPPILTITDSTGSGAIAVPVMGGAQSGDTVTVSAPAGMLVTGSGNSPALTSAAVSNYAGRFEAGACGYSDFGRPSTQWTMGAGFVQGWPVGSSVGNYFLSQNWLKRGDIWTNAVTSSSDGWPLTITGTATTTIDDPSPGNGVDGKNYPSQIGTWTLVADDTNPSAMMQPSLTANSSATVTALGTGGLVYGGTLSGGIQVGRVWQWTIARVASPAVHDLAIKINVTRSGVSGTYNQTLTNAYLFPPLATNAALPNYPARDGLSGITADQSLLNWLKTPTGRGPYSLRWGESVLGFGYTGNITDVSDLRSGNAASWNDSRNPAPNWPSGRRTITVNTVRTYSPSTSLNWPTNWTGGTVTWQSPNVFINQWSTLPGSALDSITINSGGTNYSANVTCQVTGGGGSGVKIGTITRVGGAITAVAVTCGGSGFTSAPMIAFSDTTGSGATATANMVTPPRGIAQILVNRGGSGYVTPTAAVSGGGGSGCVLGIPVVSGGVITSIPVTSPGGGYTSPPTVTITDSQGSGADAVAVAAFTPADPGWMDPFQNGQYFCAELICSAPHNLKSGQVASFLSASGTIQVSKGSAAVVNFGVSGWVGGGTKRIFPTDVDKFVILTWNNGPTAAGMPGNVNNVAGTFGVNVSILLPQPPLTCAPYEATAQVTGSFPGTNHWCAVSTPATDLCVAEIAKRVRDNLPPGRKVFVELGDEFWNTTWMDTFIYPMGRFNAWGPRLVNTDLAYFTRASQIHDIFVSVFNQIDINGNSNRGGEIVRLFGTQAAGANHTTAFVNYANAYNSVNAAAPRMLHCVAGATYVDMSSRNNADPGTAATVNVTGGGAAGGNLAAGNYYVCYTWIDSLSGRESGPGTAGGNGRSAQFTVVAGNIPRVTITFPSGPAWASSANIYLTAAGGAAGTEVLYASGVTTTTYDLAAANTGTVAVPRTSRLPTVAEACSSLVSGHPTAVAYLTATPWTRAAIMDMYRYQIKYSPSYNSSFGKGNGHIGALANYQIPALQGTAAPYYCGYEGGLETIAPSGCSITDINGTIQPEAGGGYLTNKLNHDLYYAPEVYDAEMTAFDICEDGGMVFRNSYHCAGQIGSLTGTDTTTSALWPNVTWSGQPAGRGDGSPITTPGTEYTLGTAVTNKFWADDGKAHHLDNVSVRLQAWRDRADVTSPLSATPLRGHRAWRPLSAAQLWYLRG